MESRKMIVWIILAGVAVLFIAVYGTTWYMGKKRAKALQALAPALSFTFTASGDDMLIGELGEFHLFSQGYRRRISNVLQGKFNLVPVTVMDYKYTTGGGKSSHTWTQTVLVFDSDKLQLPRFLLRPENLFDKIESAFGYKDINFDTAPVFSEKYLLRGENEAAVRSAFNAGILQYYEQHPGLSTEADGKKLIFYRTSKVVPPDKIQAFLQEGYDAFELFKVR
jgi:hypothetical protein